MAWVLTATAVACAPPSQGPPEGAVATVSGEAISALDLRLPPNVSEEGRRRALDHAILRTLATSEARRRGLADGPEVAEELAAIEREAKERQGAVLGEALLASLREELVLLDEALRAHYEATKLRYAERQLRLLRHAFPSREAAEQALAGGAFPGEGAESLGPAPVAKLPRTVLPEALRPTDPRLFALLVRPVAAWHESRPTPQPACRLAAPAVPMPPA